jgi:cytochrome c peroxidase
MRSLAAFVVLAFALAPAVRAQGLEPIEQLGKELFFDKISSPSRSMSCAGCHALATGGVGPIASLNLKGGVYRGADRQRFGNRKPPSSTYSAFAPIFHFDEDLGEFVGGVFWDGRATGERLGSPAAEQALGPWLNPVEQNARSKEMVCLQVKRSKYAQLFESVWGSGSLDCSPSGVEATYDRFGLSIAAYEGSVEHSPFNSKFDEYWRACLTAGNDPEACGTAEGEKAALDPGNVLSDMEWDGLIEFGEYCSACHDSTRPGRNALGEETPPLFTNFTFANLGVPKNPENPFYEMDDVYLDDGEPINPLGVDWIDLGLGAFLDSRPEWAHLARENDGKFRVPTVRNVDKRPGFGFPKPYMHNGVFKSLAEVVHFYNTRDVAASGWAPPEVDRNVSRMVLEGVPLGNLELDAYAEAATVEFLKTLSDR